MLPRKKIAKKAAREAAAELAAKKEAQSEAKQSVSVTLPSVTSSSNKKDKSPKPDHGVIAVGVAEITASRGSEQTPKGPDKTLLEAAGQFESQQRAIILEDVLSSEEAALEEQLADEEAALKKQLADKEDLNREHEAFTTLKNYVQEENEARTVEMVLAGELIPTSPEFTQPSKLAPLPEYFSDMPLDVNHQALDEPESFDENYPNTSQNSAPGETDSYSYYSETHTGQTDTAYQNTRFEAEFAQLIYDIQQISPYERRSDVTEQLQEKHVIAARMGYFSCRDTTNQVYEALVAKALQYEQRSSAVAYAAEALKMISCEQNYLLMMNVYIHCNELDNAWNIYKEISPEIKMQSMKVHETILEMVRDWPNKADQHFMRYAFVACENAAHLDIDRAYALLLETGLAYDTVHENFTNTVKQLVDERRLMNSTKQQPNPPLPLIQAAYNKCIARNKQLINQPGYSKQKQETFYQQQERNRKSVDQRTKNAIYAAYCGNTDHTSVSHPTSVPIQIAETKTQQALPPTNRSVAAFLAEKDSRLRQHNHRQAQHSTSSWAAVASSSNRAQTSADSSPDLRATLAQAAIAKTSTHASVAASLDRRTSHNTHSNTHLPTQSNVPSQSTANNRSRFMPAQQQKDPKGVNARRTPPQKQPGDNYTARGLR